MWKQGMDLDTTIKKGIDARSFAGIVTATLVKGFPGSISPSSQSREKLGCWFCMALPLNTFNKVKHLGHGCLELPNFVLQMPKSFFMVYQTNINRSSNKIERSRSGYDTQISVISSVGSRCIFSVQILL